MHIEMESIELDHHKEVDHDITHRDERELFDHHHPRRHRFHARRYTKHTDDNVDIQRQILKNVNRLAPCKVYKGVKRRMKWIRRNREAWNEIRKKRLKWEEEQITRHDYSNEDDNNSTIPLMLADDSADIIVEWVSLPRDAVFLILDKLMERIDHVRFAAASKEWSAAVKCYNHTTQRWHNQQQSLPMLMIPPRSDDNQQQRLYSIVERKVYYTKIDMIKSIRQSGNYFCGSNFGWLATTDMSMEAVIDWRYIRCPDLVEVTYRITLQNMFRREKDPIHLPCLTLLFRDHNVEHVERNNYLVPHVILSADPSLDPDNYIVLAFCDDRVSFACIKGGQQDWTLFNKQTPPLWLNPESKSVILYKNQVYTVTEFGEFMRTDMNNRSNPLEPPELEVLRVTPPLGRFSPEDDLCENSYLVESTDGDLLLVRKFSGWKKKAAAGIDEEDEGRHSLYVSITFLVYKVVFDEKDDSWIRLVEVKSIGDDALFVSDSFSKSVRASKFSGCQPNSIYYTSDDARKHFPATGATPGKDGLECEMGIFSFDDKTTTPLFSSQEECYWSQFMPLWVLPSFH